MKRRIAIIGGGIAGIAAAIRLAEAGEMPIVIESRKRLGGRATSHVDPHSGASIDNCQHVLLGCCTNLIDLYHRLGVAPLIEWHDTLYWTLGGHQATPEVIRRGWLPAPFHLAGSFARLKLLDHESKRAIRRALFRMLRMGPRGRVMWSNRTFADFLNDCDQPIQAVRRFWEPIVVSACNLSVSRLGADFALQVFQEAFLANSWSYTMGVPRVPLTRLYDAATSIIESAGGQVLLGASAKAIAFDGRRVTSVVTDDDVVTASSVISTVPFERLDKLISDALKRADRRLQHLDRMEFSPILGVHLWFDQQIMELPHLVLIEPPQGVQWLFNKGIVTDGTNRIQHVHAVISAAESWMHLDETEIVRRVLIDVHHALPRALGLDPVDARAIKERRATFAPVPGVYAFRPSAMPEFASGGGVENLFLAGDWCDTGWPATMEGAVRSGYAAAHASNDRLTTPPRDRMSGDTDRAPDAPPRAESTRGIVADVPASLLARFLGMR